MGFYMESTPAWLPAYLQAWVDQSQVRSCHLMEITKIGDKDPQIPQGPLGPEPGWAGRA